MEGGLYFEANTGVLIAVRNSVKLTLIASFQ